MKSAPDSSERGTGPASIGTLDEFENIPNRGRFGGNPTDYNPKVMRWLVAVLACFWVGLILAVRSCA
jgi:hypothetical protein